MTKRQIVIFSGFNRAMFDSVGCTEEGIHKSLTEEWIKPRAEIWKKYTWKSILNQTYEDWVYCLCCHPDAMEITNRYFSDIQDERFFLAYSETNQEREIMKVIAGDNEQIVGVRIDSDDMYHPSAIAELYRALYNKTHDWFMWRKGYGYQYNEKKHIMKGYRAPSTPFFAKRYTVGEWLAQGEIKNKCQHHRVTKIHNPKFLSDGKILVGLTGLNSSTKLKHPCFKRKIYEPEKSEILKEFGLVKNLKKKIARIENAIKRANS